MTSTATTTSPEIIARELLYDGWYRFERLSLKMPDGKAVERHLLHNGSAAAVLPYDVERRCILLIQQPRAAVIDAREPPLFECIAGNLDGDTPETCIRKEALEEAGLILGKLEPIANIWPIPPVSTERVQLYLAPYTLADRISQGGGAEDEDEHITVAEVPFAHLQTLVAEGLLPDAKTLVAAQALMLRHPEFWSPTA
ncbi:NUDIX domain-containing protein [Novosphingobium decolorationis]|uniref:GDP-mannose pyrophosphatase n=1 Tax=Novosphingobium decolorationis TaxID=2698673 RepID=A0ABX8E469_9SPHN|nr:NUDIX domain-containing protein [Novosphingobium decolorationis]QVM83722.1 NUDIX domain-containing protein [Novosphingobium decolorationis]